MAQFFVTVDTFVENKRKILFLTAQKKNLPYPELKTDFKNLGRLDEFERHVVFLDSNRDAIINGIKLFIKNQIDIPDEFHTPIFRELKEDVMLLNSKEVRRSGKLEAKIKEGIRKNIEPQFREEIQQHLKMHFEDSKQRLTAIQHNDHYKWIGKLYPAVFSSQRTVFFMSVDKFLSKNSIIIDRSYFFTDPIFLKDTLIFIDEFDASKKIVQKRIIESCLKYKIDILHLFQQIHSVLTTHEFSGGILQESNAAWEIRQSRPDYGPPESILHRLRTMAEDVFQKHGLEYGFKTDPELLADNKKPFLFHDFENHTIFNGKNELVTTKLNQEHKQHWIKSTDVLTDDESLFQNQLNEIKGFHNFFLKSVGILAKNFADLHSEKQSGLPIEDQRPLFHESAIRTILHEFGITGDYLDFLSNAVLQKEEPFRKYGSLAEIPKPRFYDIGFRYYDIVDNEDHDTLSRPYMFAFDATPEGVLANICSIAKVIGISATGTIPSNIGNYDLEFLRARLQGQFRVPTAKEIATIQEKYEEATCNYHRVDFRSKIIGDTVGRKITDEQAIEMMSELLNSEENAHKLWYDIQKRAKNGKSPLYKYERYYRALSAWHYFISHPEVQSMLCFFSKGTSPGDPDFDLDLIQEYAGRILRISNPDAGELAPDRIMMTLGGPTFDSQKERLKTSLSNGERRFILTAYLSVGAGQNLDYHIPENLSPIHINDWEPRPTMDINAIYLDRPSNLLVNINQVEGKSTLFAEHLFELEGFRESGELSKGQFRTKLRAGFEAFRGIFPKDNWPSLYGTREYNYYIKIILLQAIGRICRTNMKHKSVHILFDSKVLEYFQKYPLPQSVVTVKEFKQVLNLAKEIDDSNQDLRDRLKIIAQDTNRYNFRQVHGYLKRPWTEQSMAHWQDLRDQTLRQPVLSGSEECPYEMQKIYLELPEPNTTYFYSQENDFGKVKISFHSETGFTQVTEESSRLKELMEYPSLKQFFRDSGYATSFKSNAQYMLTPVIFNNIYKGALGEVCGHHIFETELGISLEDLPLEHFEMFDFKMPGKNTYIDFKNWTDRAYVSEKEQIVHTKEKMARIGAEKVFIVNLVGSDRARTKPTLPNQEIIQIPCLLKNGQLDTASLQLINEHLHRG